MKLIRKLGRFSKHLLVTNTVISCAQIGTADVMQQLFNGDIKRKGWDYTRTARMAAIGIVIGPMLHYFYRILDSRSFKGGRRKVVVKKLCCDAASMPFFSCTFITVGGLLEGSPFSNALREYRQKMWHIFTVDILIWPPAQFVSFWFLPPSIRVVYVNVVSLVYNFLMSYIKNNDIAGIKKSM
ncbi:Mpv17 / PMP22 family protein [Dictyocaulus viviparus]|uniref:Mpv17 / PMP22 family protein n=1 Tax=Dictyocaulus viviparus TaxID=29172 RepID=A0A0D8XK67_DICVI|nr:Mpv17 / PMP22 family protein [Dictyocaulus viviparus]